jgi:hypothetical protein
MLASRGEIEAPGERGCIRKDASYGVGRKRREREDASERTHHEERVRERSKRRERWDASERTHHLEWDGRIGKEGMHPKGRITKSGGPSDGSNGMHP